MYSYHLTDLFLKIIYRTPWYSLKQLQYFETWRSFQGNWNFFTHLSNSFISNHMSVCFSERRSAFWILSDNQNGIGHLSFTTLKYFSYLKISLLFCRIKPNIFYLTGEVDELTLFLEILGVSRSINFNLIRLQIFGWKTVLCCQATTFSLYMAVKFTTSEWLNFCSVNSASLFCFNDTFLQKRSFKPLHPDSYLLNYVMHFIDKWCSEQSCNLTNFCEITE